MEIIILILLHSKGKVIWSLTESILQDEQITMCMIIVVIKWLNPTDSREY